jgi:hypothetical protein
MGIKNRNVANLTQNSFFREQFLSKIKNLLTNYFLFPFFFFLANDAKFAKIKKSQAQSDPIQTSKQTPILIYIHEPIKFIVTPSE